jgi:flagellar motor switch protein FliN
MENWKEHFQKYIPDIEQFLTSVLLEETNIDVVSTERFEKQELLDKLLEDDIFLFTKDQKYDTDVTIILENEWYGLLSSIMLGVEEKSNNEITRDLLKKFSGELTATIKPKLHEDGIEADPTESEVLVHGQIAKKLDHTEYLYTKMEIEGLADERVRASLLIGDPQFKEDSEEDANQKSADTSEKSESKSDISEEKASEQEVKEGTVENVISARHIEFEDFEEPGSGLTNGDARHMDMLKDVEMDVSVELGRIELPLGKILQLSKGSVIELEKLAGEPVDIFVNGHCIAHGEVVVIDEHFGVRISNLVTTHQRFAKLK